MDIKRTITLNNHVKIPILGFGVYRIPSGDECRNAVRTAIEFGYRHLDTARIYCNEKSVGRAIKDTGIARSELFVTTKLWLTDIQDPRKGLESSLERLGLDYVDLYLIHWPFKGYEQAYLTLEQLQKEGLCRAIGVSNFKEHHLQRLTACGASVIPQINQVECHPENAQTELLSYCRQHNIALEAYSPLGGEGMTLVNDPRIIAISEYYKVTAAQVILRWNLQRGVIVIPKSVNPNRILENSKLFDFELNSDDMQTLNSINRNKQRAFDSDKIDERPVESYPVMHDEE